MNSENTVGENDATRCAAPSLELSKQRTASAGGKARDVNSTFIIIVLVTKCRSVGF